MLSIMSSTKVITLSSDHCILYFCETFLTFKVYIYIILDINILINEKTLIQILNKLSTLTFIKLNDLKNMKFWSLSIFKKSKNQNFNSLLIEQIVVSIR